MALILVIDDDSQIRRLLKVALAKAGHSVTAADSADSGLAHLRTEPCDLVLLDIEMPVKNGVICLQEIRKDKSIAHLPVLMVTGTPLREAVCRVAKLGVSGIVIKTGAWLPDLLKRVASLSPEKTPVASPEPKTPAPSTDAQPPRVPAKQVAVAASSAVVESKKQNAPTSLNVDASMTYEQALEALQNMTPIVARSELLQTMLDEAVNVRAMRPAVQQVLRLSQGSDASIQTLANAIRQDQALSVRLLKMANSSLYAHGDRVDTVIKAVSRIGLAQIHNVVLTVGILDAFDSLPTTGSIRPDWFWEHGTACGLLATRIAQACGFHKDLCDALFTGGLLHDLGRLLYAEHLPGQYPKVVETATQLGLPLELVESRLLLLNHADITDRLLRHWKFAQSLVVPVALHHLSLDKIKLTAPRAAGETVALALANRLAFAMLLGCSGNEVINPLEDLIAHLQISPEKLSEICAQVRTEFTDMRLNMLSHTSGQHVSYQESIRKTIGNIRLYPLAVNPLTDPMRILADSLTDAFSDGPSVITLRISHPREKAAALDLLQNQPQEEGFLPPPVLVVGNNKGCLLAETEFAGRTVRQVTLPRPLHRLIADIQQLSGLSHHEVSKAA